MTEEVAPAEKVFVRAIRPHGEHAVGDEYWTDLTHAQFLEDRTLVVRAEPSVNSRDVALAREPEPADEPKVDTPPRKRTRAKD